MKKNRIANLLASLQALGRKKTRHPTASADHGNGQGIVAADYTVTSQDIASPAAAVMTGKPVTTQSRTDKLVMQHDYLGDVAGVAQLSPSKKPVILLGELVFASIEKPEPRKGFIAQPARSLSKPLQIGKTRHLHVLVHETLLNAPKKAKFALAVDSIIRYGRKQKGRCILINGFHTVDETYINLYTFDKGDLVKINEKILVDADNFRYETEIRQLLDQHNHPDTRLIWTNPLIPIEYPGLILAKDAPFAGAKAITLTRHASHTGLRQNILPIGIAAVSVMGYAVTVGMDVSRFNAAKQDYQRLASSGTTSTESLDLLRARDQWMKAEKPLQKQLPKLDALLIAIGNNKDWRISQITLTAPEQSNEGQPGQPADEAGITFKLRIPRQAEIPPLDQAQPVLADLASAANITLRLVPQGWQETNEGNQKWLSLTIKSGNGETAPAQQ